MAAAPRRTRRTDTPDKKTNHGILTCAIMLAAAMALAATAAWAKPAPVTESARLCSDDNSQEARASATTLRETIEVDGMRDGEYELVAHLRVLDGDGRDSGPLVVGGREVTGTSSALVEGGTMSATVPIELDASALAGKTVSCLWEALRDGRVEASGGDVSDGGQRIRFPSLDATLTTDDDGPDARAEAHSRLVASVSCGNLEDGQRYTALVTLSDAETGRQVVSASGTPAIATAELSPLGGEASASIPIEADASTLAGRRVVATTKVLRGQTEVAAHAGDMGRSVGFPRLSVETRRADGCASIVDTVSYEGLMPGSPYVLQGSVRDAETGALILEPEGNGHELALSPDATSGVVEVTLAADRAALANRPLVTTETLRSPATGEALATAEGTSKGGTISMPSFSASIVGGTTGEAWEAASEGATIRAAVRYSHLTPGAEYELRGALFASPSGGTEPVATESATLVPQTEDGTAEIRFSLDASGLAGDDVSGSLLVTSGGAEVASLGVTECGTVHLPAVDVRLADAGSGQREVLGDEDARLVAEVCYTNMPVGQCCTAGVRLLDAETLLPLTDAEGHEAACQEAFVPDTGDGSLSLPLSLDASSLAGRSVVAEETVLAGTSDVTGGACQWSDDRMVRIPASSSDLVDDLDGDRIAAAGPATLCCLVSYESVEPGAEHVATVELADARTGEPIAGPDGSPISASAPFVPDDEEGSVALTVGLDASALRGASVATRSTLSRQGRILAEEGGGSAGAVRVPAISADAVGAPAGDRELPATEDAHAKVTVSCTNLEPGLDYVVACSLVDAETGETVGEEESKVSGDGGGSATRELAIPIDARGLSGRALCPRASLSLDGGALASCDGTLSPEAALHVPGITLTPRPNGDATEVAYDMLTPGAEYVVTLSATDPAGHEAGSSSLRFTPTSPSGTLDAGLRLAKEKQKAGRLEVGATLTRDGREVASAATTVDTVPRSAEATVDTAPVGATPDEEGPGEGARQVGEATIPILAGGLAMALLATGAAALRGLAKEGVDHDAR